MRVLLFTFGTLQNGIMYKKKIPLTLRCGINLFNEVLAGKWKTMIIFYISHGNERPAELLRLMPDVDRRVLMQQLQEMTLSGLVTKETLTSKPLVVKYRLSEMGKSLLPVIATMEEWSEKYRSDIEKYIGIKVELIKPLVSQ